MYQQPYQQQQQGQTLHQPILTDEDLAYTVLADLKRVVSEYTTAATESSCQQVRALFTNLLNSTLQMQGQLFKVMEQNNMYSTSSPALRQEIDKQLKQNQQTAQKTDQFLQQLSLGGGGYRIQQQYQPVQYQQPQNTQYQQHAGQSQQQHNPNPYYM
ncbi:spore coat protein [Paenibacillus sp. OV219]|uniref:spore coat protein n=1 Tax=Paenibacillus sp. OV219 TaxID=1884377 RepID=UPI0008C3461A|nr:spore coat protein [Paenibacillus sp. OV219]SEN77714.1 Spore coat protein CotF [Paenibacillus sp. OV219]